MKKLWNEMKENLQPQGWISLIMITFMFGLIFTSVGCSTIAEQFSDLPKQVATMQAGLAAAEHTALIYASLPACGKTGAILCRSPDVTKRIKDADDKAFTLVEAAHQSLDETTIGAAQTALGALKSLTDSLPQTSGVAK